MEKKTKLSISGNIKKSIKSIEIAKTKGKNSVFIEKKSGKFQGKGSSSQVSERRYEQKNKKFSSEKPFYNKFPPKSKNFSSPNDFDKRKLAEQRATKKFKDEVVVSSFKIRIVNYLTLTFFRGIVSSLFLMLLKIL